MAQAEIVTYLSGELLQVDLEVEAEELEDHVEAVPGRDHHLVQLDHRPVVQLLQRRKGSFCLRLKAALNDRR